MCVCVWRGRERERERERAKVRGHILHEHLQGIIPAYMPIPLATVTTEYSELHGWHTQSINPTPEDRRPVRSRVQPLGEART